MLGNTECECGHHFENVRNLGRGVQRDVATKWLWHGCNCTWLHGHWQQTLLHVALADFERGFLKCFFDATLGGLDLQIPGVTLVRFQIFVDDGGITERFFNIDNCFQNLVFHVNEVECIT